MKEDICSIPVSEVFGKKSGCPICELQRIVENNAIRFTLGDSKMQPHIRMQTNERGFCRKHFSDLLNTRRFTELGIILESRLAMMAEMRQKDLTEYITAQSGTCFICDTVRSNMNILLREMFYLYETEPEFRELFAEQEHFCCEHFSLLCRKENKKYLKRHYKDMTADIYKTALNDIKILHNDVNYFNSMYDYRNSTSTDFKGTENVVEEIFKFFNGAL